MKKLVVHIELSDYHSISVEKELGEEDVEAFENGWADEMAEDLFWENATYSYELVDEGD